MTEPHLAVITRLSAEFAAMSHQMARVSGDLVELQRVLGQPVRHPIPFVYPHFPQALPQTPAVPQDPQHRPPPPAGWMPPPPPPQQFTPYAPPPQEPPSAPVAQPKAPRAEGWIGKVLAVAGVAVTLIGVVLLVVLAAQAGLLRPEIRVGAGAVLAAGLVGAARWLYTRPGGRVGATSLAATGVAAAYIDVIALTTVYGWVSAPVGLVIAAVVGGAGLVLARRWDSQHLGLLVLVPLTVLAPVVTDGITLLLVGFMLTLAAASVPVQLGKDWIWLHAARIVAVTFPLVIALVGSAIGSRRDLAIVGASGIAAFLAIVSALILLRYTGNRAFMGILTAIGLVPALAVTAACDRVVAALVAAALAAALLSIVLVADRLPGVAGVVRQIWSAMSAVSALVAVTVAFDGPVAGPVLLAMAAVVTIAGRRDLVARWIAIGFSVIGAGCYLAYTPPGVLIRATQLSTGIALSTLVACVLVGANAALTVWVWVRAAPRTSRVDDDVVRIGWFGAAVVFVYAVTTFTVTAGVMVGGRDGGFLAGHMAATITWIVMAAALFRYAARLDKPARSLPIGGGLALVVAAMAKLFLFDLGTLDGIFRVAVFIVVGLILLGMGAGYARLLAQQDKQHDDESEQEQPSQV